MKLSHLPTSLIPSYSHFSSAAIRPPSSNLHSLALTLQSSTRSIKSCGVRNIPKHTQTASLLNANEYQLTVFDKCEALYMPTGSTADTCVNIEQYHWAHSGTWKKARCYYGTEGKAILTKFWDCLYIGTSNCGTVYKLKEAIHGSFARRCPYDAEPGYIRPVELG